MASGQVLLKPYTPDPKPAPRPRETYFYHPGYKRPYDTLFRLPRLDTTYTPLSASASISSSASIIKGIHFHTALLACQVVANNAFDGYLSTDQNGLKRVILKPDELLTGDSYWFHAHTPFSPETERQHNDANANAAATANATASATLTATASQSPSHCTCDEIPYPIVPSFRDWEFPHDCFKSLHWCSCTVNPNSTIVSPPSPALSEDQTDRHSPNETTCMPPPSTPNTSFHRGERCALSGISYGLQRSHLIAAAEEKWFRQNAMQVCEGASLSLSEACNRLSLRNDLNDVWDSHSFALVPKGSQRHFVIHVFTTAGVQSCEFAAAWHNVLVRPGALEGKVDEYLFTKFAQAIFMLLKLFIVGSPIRRRVARLRLEQDPESLREELRVVKEWMSGSQLDEAYGGGGSRSASAKRKRSSHDAGAQLDSDGEDDWHERYVRRRDSWGSSEDDSTADMEARYEDPIQGLEDLGHGYWRDSLGGIKYDETPANAAWLEKVMQEELPPGYRRDSWGGIKYDPTAENEAWYEDTEADREELERGRPRQRGQRHQRHSDFNSVDTMPSLTSSHAPLGVEDVGSPSSRGTTLTLTSLMKAGSSDTEGTATGMDQVL